MSVSIAAVLLAATALPQEGAPQVRDWLASGPPEACVDVLFVGDGYTTKELSRSGKYWKDVDRCAKRLFQELPFSAYKEHFNVRALFAESKQTGCDRADGEHTVDTVLDSAFDTADGRLLVFRDGARLKALVEGAGPADIVFVMVNTERYGGAGTTLPASQLGGRPLAAPTYAAQDTTSFLIAVHELGHSFADLDDEYVDDNLLSTFTLPEKGDLPEANVSLPDAFERDSFERVKATVKWRHFLALPGAQKARWFHEGGYYRDKGVYRPWPTCMMRDHGEPFCPVCCEEMAKAIHATCALPWDDAVWHKAHPLSGWR